MGRDGVGKVTGEWVSAHGVRARRARAPSWQGAMHATVIGDKIRRGCNAEGRGREREASDKVNKTKRVLATMMASYLCRFAEGDGQGETEDSGFAVGVGHRGLGR